MFSFFRVRGDPPNLFLAAFITHAYVVHLENSFELVHISFVALYILSFPGDPYTILYNKNQISNNAALLRNHE